MLLSGVVGVVAGALALGVDRLIPALNRCVERGLVAGGDSWAALGRLSVPALCVLVFVGVAGFLRKHAPEAAGPGISQVMSAVGRRGGFIRRRVIPVKPVATALCIGAGAPLGMEGPVVQTGAALGSLAGRWARMGVANMRILAAAGAAAALAAKYGAPIGGAVFSAELILGSASTGALLPLIVASFLAVLTRHVIMGHVPEYSISVGSTSGLADYALYVLLGVACGMAALYFIRCIFAIEGLMRSALGSWWTRAAFGGLMVALLWLVSPCLIGTGRPVIQRLLTGVEFPAAALVLMVLLKPALSSMALGAGASGGIFAPSLFTGAALGALFAQGAGALVPWETAPSAFYVMAGMAGVMAAVMRAPLQAILITFELTHNYSVVPALMIVCVVGMKVCELFEPESAFTMRLAQRGEKLREGLDVAVLESLSVREVMNPDYVALPCRASIWEVNDEVRVSENRTFPVLNEDGHLLGLVTLPALMGACVSRRDGAAAPKIADLVEPQVVYLSPGDSLYDAWLTMGNYDYDCLPVCVSCGDGLRIVGICEKEAITERYDRQSFVRMNLPPSG